MTNIYYFNINLVEKIYSSKKKKSPINKESTIYPEILRVRGHDMAHFSSLGVGKLILKKK